MFCLYNFLLFCFSGSCCCCCYSILHTCFAATYCRPLQLFLFFTFSCRLTSHLSNMGPMIRPFSGVRQKGVSNLLGTPTSVCGLFFAFIISSLVSWCLLICSWQLLALRSRLVRGYSLTHLRWVEAASAGIAALGHFVLLYFAAHWRLPMPWPLKCCMLRRRRGTTKAVCSQAPCSNSDTSGEDGRAASGFAEDLEVRFRDGAARASAASVAVSVGVPGGLQHRSTSRPPMSSSGDAKFGAGGVPFGNGEASGGSGSNFREGCVSMRKVQDYLTRYCSLVVAVIACAICLVHIGIHVTIPPRHRQSQEIILGLIRVISDTVLLVIYEVFIALRLAKLATQTSHGGNSGSNSNSASRLLFVQVTLKVSGALFALAVFCISTRIVWLFLTVNTLEHLKLGVTDSFDFCSLEGMHTDPTLSRSLVWPALLHRRTFNFWTGSEKCSHASGLPSISYLDAEEHLLLVSPLCVDGERPHVYLHRPENNEFNGNANVELPETERGNLEYHRQLEALYGTKALAFEHGVVVHRDPVTSLILSVEVDPQTLAAHARKPRTPQERAARREWPSEGHAVLSVPLGLSAAYTVHCEALEHEEYHLYPLNDAMLDAYSAGAGGVREAQCVPEWKRAGRSEAPQPPATPEEPAGNVFIMLFDAVSRQEMQRSLPKLSRAIADFAMSNTTGHLVLEAQGAMTLGVNTAANLVPFLSGITANAVGLPGEVKFTDVSFMNSSVFVLAKEKYGDTINTAFTSAFCHDLFEYLMGHTVPSSGAGGRILGVDRYMYQPFCHLDYSGVHSNFKGPYSIVRRCMAGEAVWDHMVNYTEATLAKQLEDGRRALNATTDTPTRRGDCHATLPEGGFGKNFFHVMYMTEGHEGTHGVIPLVDDSLTRFFHDLRYKLRFFDNPLNTFILLADHGNHMGHYYEYSRAGQFERGTPPTVMLVHPDVLNRVDRNKGRDPFTSVQNLLQRTKRVSTPLDVYLTLGDLLNVKVDVYYKYKSPSTFHAASLFDLRDDASSAPARNCSQFSSDVEHYACPLDFCRTA